MNRFKRGFSRVCFLIGFSILVSCGVSKSLHDLPDVSKYNQNIPERVQLNDSTYQLERASLTKNRQGQWELYVSGDAYELGLKTGSLTRELFWNQEEAFLGKVSEIVPSKFKQYLLRKMLAWYNRKMYLYIKPEYKAEIYGLAQYAGDTYDYVADDYLRVLYLHGAHDIGHAFQDLALVGCSSFAVWGDKTEDGSLLIARNLDFYAGDEFSKNKIIAFVDPVEGHKYMSVTWPGMIGVVSGMNEKGLTVTINAGKSKIPLVAKTPISLVTREILQYAGTIDEAIAIAKKRQVFVSESIFIGSAADKRAITIEVSPDNFGIYDVENTSELICTNHFQSEAFASDKRNLKQIEESHSAYRYERMEELLDASPKITPEIAVDILRDKKGVHGDTLGYGNEKALNQLLAHHGIVFKPEQLQVWVSANPYQLGEFVFYDLNEVFKTVTNRNKVSSFQNEVFNIEKDSFLYSQAYKDYEAYRIQSREISKAIDEGEHLDIAKLHNFINLNPEFWEVYYLVGTYYYEKGYYRAALNEFEKALTKEVTTVPSRKNVEEYIKKSKRKLNR